MDDDFLLHSDAARRLYHEYAAPMPILDFHCHLDPREVAEDRRWDNPALIWLGGDHYKWRAMRANGVPERFCTGDAPDREKFRKWAETVACAARNPLFHWSHLELRRCFGLSGLLTPATADGIYDACAAALNAPDFSARGLLRRMRVKAICTTDDAASDLRWHRRIRDDGFEIKVLPTFRPDRVMNLADPAAWREYAGLLEQAAGAQIRSFDALIAALDARHAFFHDCGCRLADHGLEQACAADFTAAQCEAALRRLREARAPDADEQRAFRSAVLLETARMHARRGWAMQLHLGAMRNNNTRMFRRLGPDTGFDSIGDFEQARPLARFLDALASADELPKTILYNLNPSDNAVMAAMLGNFQDGSVPGKMQWGPAWWFLDQKDGMERHLETLSQLGLLSRFVGMATDSRSFLSFPRHEYFRRILCNLIGRDVAGGELPDDIDWLGRMVQDICFNNARDYLRLGIQPATEGMANDGIR
ncbi:MAG: glucuronate isomerase [Lentisphaerae bacterium]|nr:glucuronate isomerase [Lentisphaerota bacterium]